MKTKTVFETTQQWARDNFAQFVGTHHDITSLFNQLGQLYEAWPGDSTKRWLFIYSPHSVNDLFEVGGGLDRMAAAVAKLLTVSMQGGMLLGVDASQNWGTKNCVITFTPLVICKAATSAPYDK